MIRLTTLAPGLLIALLLAAPAAAQPRHDQLREAEQSRREELAAQREAAQRATAARTENTASVSINRASRSGRPCNPSKAASTTVENPLRIST